MFHLVEDGDFTEASVGLARTVLRARPLQSCNYKYCNWHNGIDSDKCLEAVFEDEHEFDYDKMTPSSIKQWQKFFATTLRQRVDSPTFQRLVNTLYCRSPLEGCFIVEALIEQRKKKTVLDPRMVLYINDLLHLQKVNLADVLSTLFEPFEKVLRDAQGHAENFPKSGPSFEIAVLQSVTTEISEGRRPETREEAILVLRCLLYWIAVHRDYSEGANDLSEVLYSTWEALGLLVAELGNNVIVSELLRRGLPADVKRSFIHTFPSFVGLFPQRNIQLAHALDFFKKQAGLYDAIDDALGTTLLDAADVEALSYQQSVPDNPAVLTRANLYICINAMLIGRPLFDETPVLDLLLARYRNDTTSLVTDLITASFDVLLNAMYRNEPNDFIFLVRSFLVNRLPGFLGVLAGALFPPMTVEFCITQALSHVDPAAFQSFTQIFNPRDSTGMLSEARQEFLFACALHKLIPEQSIERLIGDVPMQSLPEAGKYIKQDLVAQCTANPGRIEELIGELENMEGNAGEIASALVEIIHSLCASKDTMTLKSVCGALSRKFQALDVIMLFTRPFTLLQPLCQLLDNWVVEEDQGEHQPVYDEFGGVLLLVFVTRHRYDLQQHDLGISGSSSFVLKYLHDGSSSRSLEYLTSEENQQLGAWVRGLFETEAITNELISTCKPQEFYLLVATLFKQSLAACQAGVLSLDVLKSGFEYLLEPFLLPSLVGGLAWFTQTIWEMNGQSKKLDNTLSALQALLKPNSMSGESSAIHSAVLSIIARPLEHSLVHIQRHQPRRQDIDPLLTVLRSHSQAQRSDATSPTELDSWSSTTGGGLSAAARQTFRALTQWGLAASLDLAPPPSYTHRQLLVIVRILGADAVLQIILDEIMSQEAGTFEDVALDVAAAMICAPSGANPAIPNGMFSDAPKRQLTLRDALQLSYADAFKSSKDNAYRAGLTVRLYRRVEGLLQTVANHTANVIPVTDDMMVDLDSVPVGGQISAGSVVGGPHTDINDVLAEVEEDIAVQEFLTGSNAFGEIS